MAALCTGNYGLTQNCIDSSKEYFFVKLTDSALRAVEQYQRNQEKYNTHPTIRIEGDNGMISFPMQGQQWQQFRFSIDEIEGSFQCIKQSENHLEVQGSLPFKLRIHANEDVYETTKHRMAVAEENQKNKCTREIKPNQTDIGRKVKLKNRHSNILSKRDSTALHQFSSGNTASQFPLSPLLNLCSSSSGALNANPSNHQQNYTLNTSLTPLVTSSVPSICSMASLSPVDSSSLKSSSITHTLPNNSNSSPAIKSHLNNTSASPAASLSSALSLAAGSGTSGISNTFYGNTSSKGTVGNIGSTSLNTGCRKNATNASAIQRITKIGSRNALDITKKKLRDRLVHLLALKPYKKPELFNRLQNEGIREREKASISVILKEISIIRDNTYNLKRQIWNDVIEDWPFYTEQELQMLKRRKPQNLTPPISSDGGSSTSGQSPTSTHNGSPPPAVKRPSLDRDRYLEEPSSKKQRISHFRKDCNDLNSSLIKNQEPEENALSYGVLGCDEARRIAQRENLPDVIGTTAVTNHNSKILSSSRYNNSQIKNNTGSMSSNDKSNKNSVIQGHSKLSASYVDDSGKSRHNVDENISTSPRQSIEIRIEDHINNDSKCMESSRSSRAELLADIPYRDRSSIEAVNNGSYNDSNKSSCNYSETDININSGRTTAVIHGRHHVCSPSQNYDLSNFTSINSIEQRRRYKAEFERNYAEYRELLQIVEGVAKKFKMLALQLEENRNNQSVYRDIRRKILIEYEKTNRDRGHQKIKARFDYLHTKLAHIKSLVHDFDQTLTSSNVSGNISVAQSPLQHNSDSLGNEHFKSLSVSPSLLKKTSTNRNLSTSVITSRQGNTENPTSDFQSYQNY